MRNISASPPRSRAARHARHAGAARVAPAHRLCREIAQEASSQDIRFRPQAFAAIQEATEAYVVNFLEEANRAAVHGKRVA